MCRVMEEIRIEGMKEGKIKGEILSRIAVLRELAWEEPDILANIMDRLGLDQETAEQYMGLNAE